MRVGLMLARATNGRHACCGGSDGPTADEKLPTRQRSISVGHRSNPFAEGEERPNQSCENTDKYDEEYDVGETQRSP